MRQAVGGYSPAQPTYRIKASSIPPKSEHVFHPEPNGYLHIGHAKSICLNFGLARDYNGACHLRFDDTNPEKEEQEYVDAIIDMVQWLGFDWKYQNEDNLYFASDYFGFMYEFAQALISADLAYVDEQNAEQMRENRGTLTSAGVNSPWRNRPVEESSRLLAEMRDGLHPDGSMALRAKLTWARLILICATPSYIAFVMQPIIVPEMLGAFILCTAGRTRLKMP